MSGRFIIKDKRELFLRIIRNIIIISILGMIVTFISVHNFILGVLASICSMVVVASTVTHNISRQYEELLDELHKKFTELKKQLKKDKVI